MVLTASAAIFLAACGGSGQKAAATSSPTAAAATAVATASATPPTPPTATVAPAATATPAPTTQSIARPLPSLAPPPAAPSPPPAAGPPSAVTLEVTAQNISFDKTELHARAGAQVTALLTNKDASVDHNLTFSVPGLGHGETCTGPCTASQTFTAPVAGRYDFFCNIHSNMLGAFIVDP